MRERERVIKKVRQTDKQEGVVTTDRVEQLNKQRDGYTEERLNQRTKNNQDQGKIREIIEK